MTRYLVSFATSKYFGVQSRQGELALRRGIQHVSPWRPNELAKTDFYRAHASIFSQKRGFGYWLWKPFIILESLQRMQDGDFLLYMDAGAELTADVQPLVDLAKASQGVVPFSLHGRLSRYWTKRDCFVLMDADSELFYNSHQATGAFFCFIKNAFTLDFVNTWRRFCENPRVLTDMPSVCGLGELPDLIEHRHDQSVASLLIAKRNIPMHRDPSQYGNHLKSEPFRENGEYLGAAYARAPLVNSPYPTLINHHRQREPAPSLARRAYRAVKLKYWSLPKEEQSRQAVLPKRALEPIAARNRAALASISTWVDREALERSQFRHGLSLSELQGIDEPAGQGASCADAIVYFSQRLAQPVRYLQIGVSVGKELFQLASGLRDAALTAVDLEEINPVVAKQWRRVHRAEWHPSEASAKEGLASLTSYQVDASSNTVDYLADDPFDATAWEHLRGRSFNLVRIGRLRWPDELVQLWSLLQRFKLLTDGPFAVFWDALGYNQKGLETVWRQMCSRYGDANCIKTTLRLEGSLASQEPPNEVGILCHKLPPEDSKTKF